MADFHGRFMNDGIYKAAASPLDSFALALQGFGASKGIRSNNTLVRLDYRKESAEAPFQFDPEAGILHRTGCSAIRDSSRSALYAVWTIGPDDKKNLCPRCRPMRKESKPPVLPDPWDIVFGLLSRRRHIAGAVTPRYPSRARPAPSKCPGAIR